MLSILCASPSAELGEIVGVDLKVKLRPSTIADSVADSGRPGGHFGDDAIMPIALTVLDAMIARAEAACERYRLAAPDQRMGPYIAEKRVATRRRMEETLARLRSQRADAAGRSHMGRDG